MKKVLIASLLLMPFLSTCTTISLNNTLNFVRETNNQPYAWHQETVKGPNQRLKERFITFASPFISGCQTITKDEEVAQMLMSLIFIEQLCPDILEKHELKPVLRACFEQLQSIKMADQLHLFELQPYCDFWYFTKLFNYPEFKIDNACLEKHINPHVLKKVTNSFEALVLWNYLQALQFCSPPFYNRLKGHKKHLVTVIKKDEYMYGYYLALLLFYQTQFGHKKPTHTTQKLMKSIEKYCAQVNLQKAPSDLVANLFLCFKICKTTDSKIGRLVAQRLTRAYPKNFQEAAILFAAAA